MAVGGGREGGGSVKRPLPLTTFSLGISLKNFLTFSLNAFATLLKNLRAIPSANLKLLEIKPKSPLKKIDFLVKSL